MMDASEFVAALKIVVERSSVEGIRQLLLEPPGRRPSADLLKRSHWFNNLSKADKDMVMEIVGESVKMTLFGFLCVLDGVRSIEDSREKGKLKLYFEKELNRVLLNDHDQEYLHDLYNSEE